MQSTSDSINMKKARYSIKPATLRTLTMTNLLLLAAQFLIGMVVNLYVQIPSSHPGAEASNYFLGIVQGLGWALLHSQFALVVHITLGLLLILASFILTGFAFASRQLSWIITTLIALMGIIAAAFNGASFLNYGHDFSSLLMSVGFLLALVSYIVALYIAH